MLPDLSQLGTTLTASPLTALAAVFLGGVLTSLTPCLYPMIPITVAIIGGGESTTRLRRMLLAATYVLGLAGAYAALGLVAGLSGTLFGATSTNPWLSFAMANTMLLAALMMADVIPVPVPQAWRARAATLGDGGRFTGVLLMGTASGLVAAPCGAPVLAAVLTWVTRTQSAMLGLLYLFTFSVGMCSLLLVVAFATDSALRLPRAGPWMLWVKRAFALLLLGVAEYYLISMGQLLV
ncbi:MAG: sulfite exporter TauE/SafE family protein [Gemmatimonadetes bacterium]|jgi:cytochrome c-type biogenesis protein|nr:sulfite exporter TauE/SafE family protein [Gemmatimonadota bacterium]MBP7549280.1 sulfite exporter TauE/SafE family protein [Gemmatimonadaceae bacterium]